MIIAIGVQLAYVGCCSTCEAGFIAVLRRGLISHQVPARSQHPLGRHDLSRTAKFLSRSSVALCCRQRAAEIRKASPKKIKTGQEVQLVLDISQGLGKAESAL